MTTGGTNGNHDQDGAPWLRVERFGAALGLPAPVTPPAQHLADVAGDYGRGWQMPAPSGLRATPAQSATLTTWFLELPGQAIWSCYGLSIIHLRPIPGTPDPHVLQLEDGQPASHEILLVAYDPGQPGQPNRPAPDPSNWETWRILRPLNFTAQFGRLQDWQTVRLAHLVARALVDGLLPAEPADYRGGRDLWRASLMRTIEHMRTAGHVQGYAGAGPDVAREDADGEPGR